MVGITKIPIPDTEFRKYREWVETTNDKTIQEVMAEQITQKLKELRKQDGRCNQRSVFLQKGGIKGSCIWNGSKYKVWVRNKQHNCYYGFFPNLFSAEQELQRLFENEEKDIFSVAKKQQKYYKQQHRLETRPRLTDNTIRISRIENSKREMVLFFDSAFVNPITKKEQKQIVWSKSWFKHFPKKGIINECVKMDDGPEIILYREDLKKRLKQNKQNKGGSSNENNQ